MNRDQLHLVVCENLAREFTTALALESLDDVSVSTFPARCSPPRLDKEALLQAVSACEQDPCHYIVGPCGTAALGESPEGIAGHLKWIEACPDIFLSPRLTDYYVNRRDLLILPGELRCWDSAGLGANEAVRLARRLVLLDTGVDPDAVALLATVAAAAGLPGEVLPVGLDFLRLFLARIVLGWRLEEEKARSTAALSEAIRRSSDHAMALDLIGTLARTVTETEAIENALDLFTLLFAPGKLLFVSWRDGQPAEIQSRPATTVQPEEITERLGRLQNDHARTASGAGFLLRIGVQGEMLGLLEVDEIAFPQHLDHYLNLALILGRVCSLTISNARAYEKSTRAEETIRHQAYHDLLTGLPNRRLFQDRLTVALGQVERDKRGLAVMFVDLDGFKKVNDRYGHDVGDALLQEVAIRLQKAVRTDDTVARMGGDEFLLLLPTIEHSEDALRVAHRIRQNLERAFLKSDEEIRVTASVGIALYPQDGQDAETLLKHADAALYRVKRHGKNGIRLFGEGREPAAKPLP